MLMSRLDWLKRMQIMECLHQGQADELSRMSTDVEIAGISVEMRQLQIMMIECLDLVSE